MYYSAGTYESFAHPEKPKDVDKKSAYIIGTGSVTSPPAFGAPLPISIIPALISGTYSSVYESLQILQVYVLYPGASSVISTSFVNT